MSSAISTTTTAATQSGQFTYVDSYGSSGVAGAASDPSTAPSNATLPLMYSSEVMYIPPDLYATLPASVDMETLNSLCRLFYTTKYLGHAVSIALHNDFMNDSANAEYYPAVLVSFLNQGGLWHLFNEMIRYDVLTPDQFNTLLYDLHLCIRYVPQYLRFALSQMSVEKIQYWGEMIDQGEKYHFGSEPMSLNMQSEIKCVLYGLNPSGPAPLCSLCHGYDYSLVTTVPIHPPVVASSAQSLPTATVNSSTTTDTPAAPALASPPVVIPETKAIEEIPIAVVAPTPLPSAVPAAVLASATPSPLPPLDLSASPVPSDYSESPSIRSSTRSLPDSEASEVSLNKTASLSSPVSLSSTKPVLKGFSSILLSPVANKVVIAAPKPVIAKKPVAPVVVPLCREHLINTDAGCRSCSKAAHFSLGEIVKQFSESGAMDYSLPSSYDLQTLDKKASASSKFEFILGAIPLAHPLHVSRCSTVYREVLNADHKAPDPRQSMCEHVLGRTHYFAQFAVPNNDLPGFLIRHKDEIMKVSGVSYLRICTRDARLPWATVMVYGTDSASVKACLLMVDWVVRHSNASSGHQFSLTRQFMGAARDLAKNCGIAVAASNRGSGRSGRRRRA